MGSTPKHYCEIGSYLGSSACLMLNHHYPTFVSCIDPLNLKIKNLSQESILLNNLKKINKSNFKIYKHFSNDPELLDSFDKTNQKIDILFIDGNHSYKSVIDDFYNFSKYVTKGGFIVFDDYNDRKHSPKVKRAVNHIVCSIKNNDLPFDIIGVPINHKNALPINLTKKNESNEFILKKL